MSNEEEEKTMCGWNHWRILIEKKLLRNREKNDIGF
jgi:hypothetical protein